MAGGGRGGPDITAVEQALLGALNEIKSIRQGLSQAADASGGSTSTEWVSGALARVETDLRLQAEEFSDTVTRAKLELDPRLVQDGRTAHMLKLLQVGSHARMQSRGHNSNRLAHTLRAVTEKPNSDIARAFIQSRFGVPAPPVLPQANARTVGRGTALGKVMSTKQVRPTTMLTPSQRLDPAEPLPPLSEADVKKGMLSLVEKGLVPPTTDLTNTFYQFGGDPLLTQSLRLLDFHTRFDQPEEPLGGTLPWGDKGGYNYAPVKLDLLNMPRANLTSAEGDGSPRRSSELGASPSSLAGYASRADLEAIREEASLASLAAAGASTSGVYAAGPSTSGVFNDAATFAERQARDYNDIMDAFSLHQFVIRKGVTLDSTPEFRSFQRTYAKQWPAISELVRRIEEFAVEYLIPMVVLDGKLLAQVAKDWLPLAAGAPSMAMMPQTGGHRGSVIGRSSLPGAGGQDWVMNWATHLPNDVLISCMDNKEQVMELMRQPGRMFKGPMGREKAATRIQSQFRGHTVRLRLGRHAAATVIQIYWRLELMRRRTRALALEVKKAEFAKFQALQSGLRTNWASLSTSPRVIIHIPSLSVTGERALGLPALDVLQNGQMSRLCGLRDPNVDIVYVAPRPMSDEIEGYFHKLLTTVGALGDLAGRFRIIVPENHARLPQHLPLARVLLLSPRALKRILAFVAGRPALIVPGLTGLDEFQLSARLNIPLLAPEPAIAAALSRKSGARHLFKSGQVNVPIGATVEPSAPRAKRFTRHRGSDPAAPWVAIPAELMPEASEASDMSAPTSSEPPPRVDLLTALANLIASHPSVPRWILKIDEEFWGRGHAYVDMAGLKPVRMLLAAFARAEERKVLDAAESTVMSIVGGGGVPSPGASSVAPTPGVDGEDSAALNREELIAAMVAALRGVLPKRAAFTTPGLWPTWASFEAAFERRGGVVEACPSVVTGSPSINLLVEPNGTVRVLSTHEQMFSPAYRFIGASFPQSSVPHSALAQVGAALGEACYKAGVIGYVGVDLVALRDAGRLRLWAVDLNLRMTATQSTFDLFDFICGGTFQPDTGRYLVPKPPDIPTVDDGGPSERPAGSYMAQPTTPAVTAGPSIFTGVRVQPTAAALSHLRGTDGPVNIPMERRFYVMNDLVSHPNLALAQFNTFFHRCKLEGMVFDLQDRVGTTFMLRGNFSGGAVGVVCIGRSPQDAFTRQSEAMDFLQRLVGPDDPSRMHEDMGTFRAVHSTVHFISDKLGAAAAALAGQ